MATSGTVGTRDDKEHRMYNQLGFCSWMLHVLAKHPTAILAAGTVSVMAYASQASLGPGNYTGFESRITDYEQRVTQSYRLTNEDLVRQYGDIQHVLVLNDSDIQYVLDSCNCGDATVATVKANPDLYMAVKRIFYFDTVLRYGPRTAPVVATGKP